MSFSQLVSELAPPPEKVKKKKGFQILGPPAANSWTRACSTPKYSVLKILKVCKKSVQKSVCK